MRIALIGYTGFVGGNIFRQHTFDDLYRSSNISDIEGKHYDLIVSAGAKAVKWQANKEPETDLAHIYSLTKHLENVTTDSFVLISTTDVYPQCSSVDERTPINQQKAQPYGRHRFLLEEFVRQHFTRHTIVRLPALFGHGLKKNFIFDLLYKPECVNLVHHNSMFQFYDLDNLWKDIQIAIENNLVLVNFATEPVSARDIARAAFNIDFQNITEEPPVSYDMHTIFAHFFGKENPYLYSKAYTLKHLRQFVAREKRVISQ